MLRANSNVAAVALIQSGLIPDEKLVNLLDMALAADTVNTVKGMRSLLDAGIDALSLVAQLASLITNILAGTFDLRREARKKGFFSRNMRKLCLQCPPMILDVFVHISSNCYELAAREMVSEICFSRYDHQRGGRSSSACGRR